MTSTTITNNVAIKTNLNFLVFSIVVIFSGAAGLGYQMIWGRMLAVSLGHEIVAVLAVVAAFFLGLGLGAISLNRFIVKTSFPHRWYAALEIVIAVWALLLIPVIPFFNKIIPELIGISPNVIWHWLVAFSSSTLLFLPATFAMGATLPAIEKIVRLYWKQHGQIAGLYSLNTLGAVLGTLLTAFYIIPAIGLSSTALLFALVNGLCALITLLLFKNILRINSEATTSSVLSSLSIAKHYLLFVLFATGLLGLGYEVLVIRVLSQVLENTVYTFASVLSVYLLGTAIGAAIYQFKYAQSHVDDSIWRQRFIFLLLSTCVCCLLGIASISVSDEIYIVVSEWGGDSFLKGILSELFIALFVFLLPTIAMGALFSHVAQQTVEQLGLGKALFFNTLGAMIAPLLFGVILLPLVGAKLSLVLLSLAYLLLIPRLSKKAVAGLSMPALLAAILLLLFNPLRFVTLLPSSEIIDYKEGVMASVAVVKDGTGHRHLKVNNHFTMGGTASRYSDYRQSHLPLLLKGSAESALYLGLGTGVTFQAAKFYPELEATGVELIPEILPLLHHFDVDFEDSSWIMRPNIFSADARRFILSTQKNYDVIIAEIFHPSRDGAGSLYTREHFQLIKERLNPDGRFCQWLPLFQLDIPTLKIIIRTFINVFPNTELHLAHFSLQQPILCLLGSKSDSLYSSRWLLNRVHDRGLQQHLIKLRLNSDFALFGGYLGGTNELSAYVGDGIINTDDKPIVTYAAPNFVYQKQQAPAERLYSLMQGLKQHQGIAPFAQDQQTRLFVNQLSNYWKARDIFLKTGIGVAATDDIKNIVSNTKEPLLEAVRLSDYFTPAYRSLLGLAQGLYQVDRKASYELLSELMEASPEQASAQQLRQQLFGR